MPRPSVPICAKNQACPCTNRSHAQFGMESLVAGGTSGVTKHAWFVCRCIGSIDRDKTKCRARMLTVTEWLRRYGKQSRNCPRYCNKKHAKHAQEFESSPFALRHWWFKFHHKTLLLVHCVKVLGKLGCIRSLSARKSYTSSLRILLTRRRTSPSIRLKIRVREG